MRSSDLGLPLQVTALIEEYFNSGDHVEAAASLRVSPSTYTIPLHSANHLALDWCMCICSCISGRAA